MAVLYREDEVLISHRDVETAAYNYEKVAELVLRLISKLALAKPLTEPEKNLAEAINNLRSACKDLLI